MKLSESIVIVTGSSSGIGKSCAELLVDNGAKVIGFDKDPKKIESGSYRHIVVDIRDEDRIRNSVGEAESSYGRIDGLVNCAGIASAKKPFYELTLEEWNNLISINLTGTFLVSKYVSPVMIKNKTGRIVNISCIRSRIFRPSMAEYSASKGGVAALTSAMALDLAPFNITVNSVAPGITYTGITEKSFKEPGLEESFKSMVPGGRIAEPRDIGNVVMFLLSDAAGYINGETIFADGGYCISK